MSTKPLERDIENRACTKLERAGFVALKLNLSGNRGWPDRMVLGKFRFIVFLEFKRPGETTEPMQDYVHQKLSELGFNVCVTDNVDEAVTFVKAAYQDHTEVFRYHGWHD